MTPVTSPTRTQNPMLALQRRLKSLGISKAYLREVVFPDWWDNEAALNPAGYAEALGYVARCLGVDLRILQDPDAPLSFPPLHNAKFKLRRSASKAEVSPAANLAIRVVKTAVAAFDGTTRTIPTAASAIRQDILDRNNAWVSLANLLEWCWEKGLPVVHVSHLPKEMKKMDGLAANLDGQPVIALCSGRKQSAWLLFYLAHELGHVALDHVSASGVLLDQDTRANKPDKEENEATRFAFELIVGKPDVQFKAERWLRGDELADAAISTGRKFHVDPGFVALNYAWNSDRNQPQFGAAANALKQIEPDANASALVQAQMRSHLDFDRLPEESVAWLLRMTASDNPR